MGFEGDYDSGGFWINVCVRVCEFCLRAWNDGQEEKEGGDGPVFIDECRCSISHGVMKLRR